MDGEKKKNRKSALWLTVLIISAVVFAVALAFLIVKFLPSKDKYDDYKNPTASEVTPLADNPIDFDALKAENPDVCGFITIDGTVIDYPILRSGEKLDEDFYLDHDMYGKQKRAGSIYIQRINSADFSDPNTVIYGHNMLNGSMFAVLKKYRNRQFFDEHRTIRVCVPGHVYNYKIFSAFVYDDRHILNSFDFYSDSGYGEFIDACLNPTTLIKNVSDDVTVTPGDKIITLSTCTSAESERYLVVAVLTEDIPTK